ncbi:MAG TPA: carbon starvation CstA family protein [Terriglobales bacterium]|jgi:carbon starvation protein
MNRLLKFTVWLIVAVLGAVAFGTVALRRGEPINSLWLLTAALCTYALGYRFYSRFVATKVLGLDPARATPAERLENGRDFVPSNKWVVFGHHFAAIAGPGPLLGPVLAAQFGYLPGTLWILIGAVFGGCIQDFVILAFSVRRDGKSLTQMAKEEIGTVGGWVAFVAVFSILIVMLATVALIVVNALKASPWGTFTIAMTIPIALIMGVYLRYLRPGKVLESSVLGFLLVLAAIWGGKAVAAHPSSAQLFTFTAAALALAMIVYGFAASALPVWLLLAPRDYLSTFVKLGTIAVLALGIIAVRPQLQMPSLTRFIDGTGPVFAGKLFPFAFITIACGAISGFHSLISSGTTPKMLAREPEARLVGYGGMIAESFVAIMAMIAACSMQPGVYFSISSPAGVVGAAPAAATTKITSWGFPVTATEMHALEQAVGEQTLFNRTGGAPAFAVGMTQIFARTLGGSAVMSLWYHFAIMFEALFILSVLDAGTRVARFMLQDGLGHLHPWFKRSAAGYSNIVLTSAVVVAAWGYLLMQAVRDPLGGINSMWPIFGIVNQLLAAVALSVATSVLMRMKRARYAWVTFVPLVWLVTVTFSAAFQKVWNPAPNIGFFAHARLLQAQIAAAPEKAAQLSKLIFADRLNAGMTIFFVSLVAILMIESCALWIRILAGRAKAETHESAFVPTRLAEGEI